MATTSATMRPSAEPNKFKQVSKHAKARKGVRKLPSNPAAKRKRNRRRRPKKAAATTDVKAKAVAEKKSRTKPAKTAQPSAQVFTKAQAIRDTALELGKRARPRHVVAALAEKGINVTSPQVSATLKKMAGPKKRQRNQPALPIDFHSRLSRNSLPLNINDLIQVKELADRMGGTQRIRDALAALERLRQ
jgi:hypothetical protein